MRRFLDRLDWYRDAFAVFEDEIETFANYPGMFMGMLDEHNHDELYDGTLRLCEFAILNKANTHETRVHHVETPARILAGESDVGPVWVSELQLAVNSGDAVSGYQPIDAVNRPVVYSVAFLATMSSKHKRLARWWYDFLLSPEGQQIYIDGGFTALTGTEQGERYSFDEAGNLVIEKFTP